ncbi:MAG: aspartate carbamoyltransferase catalytic subunit [Candidatus Poriferisodalaceae bacterium]|jgi:aspartate carbamoyltransferase catalytic subunit
MSGHLLGLDELGADGIREVLALTDRFVEVGERDIPRVPALRGKTIANLFFEDSTRTRLSFETAAKRLSADVLNFSAGSSSQNKGESLRDTVETVQAMGVDAFVVRHRSSGAPWQISRWVGPGISVINGGDGWHSHPTQGLLDAYTLVQRLHGQAGDAATLEGIHVGIIGDIRHSRVARSQVEAFGALGASVTLVAPPTLLPPSLDGWPVAVSHDLDSVLPTFDVVSLLRVQQERMDEALIPSIDEYVTGYGITKARSELISDTSLIIHPGPVLRGIEIAADALDQHPGVLVTRQVTNGVAVRMAVLFLLLGSGVNVS